MTRVRVEQLGAGKIVCGLRPGDVIENDDGEAVPHLFALNRGFVFDHGDGYAELVYAPTWNIQRITLPIATILAAAEWLSGPDALRSS